MVKIATVKARIPGASAVDLLLDDNIGLTSPATIAGTEGDDDVWSFALTGLVNSTTYFYGFDGSDVIGTFKTPAADGAVYDFTIVASSCAGHSGGEYVTDDVSDSPAFARIVARAPLMMVHMGDRHYRDISTNNVTSFRSAYNDVMAQTEQHALHLAMPVAYQWSDHDFGANDSDGTSASKPAAQQVYREHVPHGPLDSASAIYQTWVIGRTQHFLLDTRSERSPKGNTDNSSKTMLGAVQKAWLLSEMAASTAELLVVYCESPWNSTNPISWGVYSTEQDELIAQWISDGLIDGLGSGKIMLVNGDYHFTAADNGSNTPGNIPVVACGPLDAGWSASEGTYSEGIFKDSHQQYVSLAFDDQTTQIVVTVKGWAVTGATEDEMFSLDLTYPA